MSVSMLHTLFWITTIVFGFDLPDDSHAIFSDEHGVFVLTEKELILSKINQGLMPRKIVSNKDLLSPRRALLSVSQNQATLDRHNEYRSTTALGQTPGHPAGTNINQLLWDPYLAKVAQDYSAKCVWQHNPNMDTDLEQYQNKTEYSFDSKSLSVGENLYYTTKEATTENLLYGIKAYYDEYAYFIFNNDTNGCCQSGEQCGHYTQVVWAETRYVGCAYTVCDGLAGAIGSGTDVVFSVCNYFPGGNVQGNSPYYAGCSCSNCASDRVCNEQGLCGGCGSLSWDFCGDYYGNCDELASSCPSSGCSLDTTNTYCEGCRYSCNTCTDDMLVARDNCTDGTTSDISSGTFDGRIVETPVESVFSGSPYCNGDNEVTQCDNCQKISVWMSVFCAVFFFYIRF